MLLPLLGRLVGKLHPFLLIVTTLIDLAHLAKFLIDLCQGRIRYAGLDGDYEPDLFDWSTPGGDGAGTGEGAGGGPHTAMIHDGLEEQMKLEHFERLVALLERVDVTNEDVDKILPNVELARTPDEALTRLERYFRQRDDENRRRLGGRTSSPTETTVDGPGDRAGTGTGTGTGERTTGDGDRRTSGGGTGDRDGDGDNDRDDDIIRVTESGYDRNGDIDGEETVPWIVQAGKAILTVGRRADGSPVTITLEGRAESRDGMLYFYPARPGLYTYQVTRLERDANGEPRELTDTVQIEIPTPMGKQLRRRRRRGR